MARSARRPLNDALAYAALRTVVATLQAMPLSLCETASRGLAWLAGDVLRVRGKLLDKNLRIAFPEASDAQRRRIGRAMWRHLLLMVAEIAHAPRRVHRTTYRRHCRLLNDERVVRGGVDARPCVLLSGHFGNFEFGGYLLGLLGFPTYTIARPIDNPHVDRFVNRFRGRTGQRILPKRGSQQEVERVLNAGGTLTLLGDQAAGKRGCWVDFFGQPASTHKAVALFTLSFAAPTVVVSTVRRGGPLDYEINARGVIDPAAAGFDLGTTTRLTEWFSGVLEAMIRDAPGQYWWVHNRWKGEPPRRRRPAAPSSNRPPAAA